ncbi:diacylglycerol kinase family lipid kinase [Horticoccus luteus]|uniref:Diacylglycerol kinase family lipid kinase n=1 Tax=Horticoccus luteus TaxID=2862869 RepID=A0A8F9XG95_9BACT|nr:diacylglycerol kinase family protein [Horticoccus luteus]QYM77980.1 diacylglycerol kinase family lipid kinase [Horticoccus luteus]
MKLRFILNPRSGANLRTPHLAADLAAYVRAHSLDADIALTTARHHAIELARTAAAQGCERIVAVGGDGTVNEVAQGLLGTSAALAIIARGSGNGLARHLGLPRALPAALALATDAAAPILPIDTGLADGHLFLTAMGVGFDADIVHEFNEHPRRGLTAYVTTTLATWRRRPTLHCSISTGAATFALDALLIGVLNADQYGNNARLAPGARVDDGLLNLVAVRPVGSVAAVLLASRLFLGGFDRSAHVVHLRAPRFIIERDAPGLLHTDGETHPAGPRVEVAVTPRSLRVVVPVRTA